MNKYVLLQAPKEDGNYYRPQIVIIDNSTSIGKSKVARYCNKGYKSVGIIESDLTPTALLSGFNSNSRKKEDKHLETAKQIINIAEKFWE